MIIFDSLCAAGMASACLFMSKLKSKGSLTSFPVEAADSAEREEGRKEGQERLLFLAS